MLGVAAAAVLAAGGVAAGLALASPSAPAAGAGSPAHTTGSSQAQLLNQALSAAGSPYGTPSASGGTSGSGTGVAGAGRHGVCARARAAERFARSHGLSRTARGASTATTRRCFAIRRRVLGFLIRRGIDGQFTLQTPRGVRTLAYERGVIQSVNPGVSFVVKASDGTSWTWHLAADSVVRDIGGPLSARSLSAGQPVWVGGPVVGGAKDARLVILRPPSPGARAATGAAGAS